MKDFSYIVDIVQCRDCGRDQYGAARSGGCPIDGGRRINVSRDRGTGEVASLHPVVDLFSNVSNRTKRISRGYRTAIIVVYIVGVIVVVGRVLIDA